MLSGGRTGQGQEQVEGQAGTQAHKGENRGEPAWEETTRRCLKKVEDRKRTRRTLVQVTIYDVFLITFHFFGNFNCIFIFISSFIFMALVCNGDSTMTA